MRISETEYGNDVINWNNGINTPPTLIEDNSENNILNDITISFVDDAKWRSNITSIEVNGIIISSSKYTI